jgi:hypothetical protein
METSLRVLEQSICECTCTCSDGAILMCDAATATALTTILNHSTVPTPISGIRYPRVSLVPVLPSVIQVTLLMSRPLSLAQQPHEAQSRYSLLDCETFLLLPRSVSSEQWLTRPSSFGVPAARVPGWCLVRRSSYSLLAIFSFRLTAIPLSQRPLGFFRRLPCLQHPYWPGL